MNLYQSLLQLSCSFNVVRVRHSIFTVDAEQESNENFMKSQDLSHTFKVVAS